MPLLPAFQRRPLVAFTVLALTTVSVLLASQVAAQTAYTPTVCDADLNDDLVVNLPDYTILANNFSPSATTTSPADLDRNSYVNLVDLSWLRLYFFDTCTPSPSSSPGPSTSPTPSSSPLSSANPTPMPGSPSPFPSTSPQPHDISVTINSMVRREISQYIYGTNDARYARTELVRSGGNRWTAYNWENNASNAGTDWQNSSDNYLCESGGYSCGGNSGTPGEAVRVRINDAQSKEAASLVTVPIVDYVSADKNGSVNSTATDTNTRWAINDPQPSGDGSSGVMGDRRVYQSEFVNFVESIFPTADIMYSLDNEPGLWPSTHPYVHPNKPTYAEMVDRSSEFAAVIKARDPNAKVFGSVAYGYNEFQTLQDAPDRTTTRAPGQVGDTYLDYFLAGMRQRSTAAGKRLLDVLDLHWYPEARDNATGCRITDCNSDSESKIQARVQAPRSLWDHSYQENSWIANDYLHAPIKLIPDVRTRIGNNYPDTKLAFTEYNYGGGNHISGGIAQADVLGIFGREGIFAANLWELNDQNQFFYGAFDMYLNYDGNGSKIGNSSLPEVTNSDIVRSSAYGMANGVATDKVYAVVINKHASPLVVKLAVSSTHSFTTARAYRLTSASSTPQSAGTLTVTGNITYYTMPAYSVTTVVFE
ncbi:MAG TPA: glycoside hydrolase family 44 protein [Vitreimonas sp.]|nr:glycoside hydrolase family 44 protein [Vitreimonas sp.]